MRKALPLSLALLAFTFVACAGDVDEDEEEITSSTEELRCRRTANGGLRCTSRTGGSSSASSNGQSTSISVGGNGGSCSSIQIKCVNGSCTCRGNNGDEKQCNGSDCQKVCCP
jgi:hypothetical protein